MAVVSSPQGSRAGLISALVVSIIIAVAMIVVAFYGYQQWGLADRKLQELTERDRPLFSDPDITDPRVAALNELKSQPEFNGLNTDIEVSMAESDQLAKLIGGNATPDKTTAIGKTALNDAAKRIDDLNKKQQISFTLPKESLTSAIAGLTDQVTLVAGQRQDLQTQLADSQKKNQQIIDAQKQQLADKDKVIQEANAKADAAAAQAQQYQQQATDAQTALQASTTTTVQGLQAANAQLTSQLQAKDKQILAQQKTIAGVLTKIHQARVNPTEPIIQHPDGDIIRITDYNTVFINLGEHQHVSKGLTFEVYDKNRGIPPLGEGLSENGLPIGKGSIEVFKVGPDTSEARIVKVEPGSQFIIGDLITNLIYDPTTPYNFFVYGSFDLSNSGVTSPTDAEVMKRLITQWGGKVQSGVNTDTDFVILGAEPIVHPISDQSDAGQVLRHTHEVEDQQKYQAIIAQASQLSIPVMNQNRFLYFIGYYDQASR